MHLTYNVKGCYRVPSALAPDFTVFPDKPAGQFELLCSYHPDVTKCWELPLLQAIVAHSIWFHEWVGVGQRQLFYSFPVTEFEDSERPGHVNRTIQVNGTFHGYQGLTSLFTDALRDLAARGWITIHDGVHPKTDTYEGGEEPVYLPTTQLFTDLCAAHDRWRDTWLEDYRLLPNPAKAIVIHSLSQSPAAHTHRQPIKPKTPATRQPRAKGGVRESIGEGVYPLIIQEALLGLPPIPDGAFAEAVYGGIASQLTPAEQLIIRHLVKTVVVEVGWCWLSHQSVVNALRDELSRLPRDPDLPINSPLMHAMKAIRLLRDAQLIRTQLIRVINPTTERPESIEVLSGDLGLMRYIPDPRPD